MAVLDVINNTLNTKILNSKEMLGILDLLLMGYFRLKHTRYERKEEKYMAQTRVAKGVDTDIQLDMKVIKSVISSKDNRCNSNQNKSRSRYVLTT